MPNPYPAGVTPPVQPRRRMTPEEVAALYSQERGITPTLPPLNPMDLAMLGLSGPAEETGLPATLLQLVRYKRPGVSALAQEAAAAYHAKPRVDPIAAKNTVFHATSPESAANILRAGEIVPDPRQLADTGLKSWQDLTKLRPLERETAIPSAYLDQARALAQQRGIPPGQIERAYKATPGREAGSVRGGDFRWFLRDLFGEGSDSALAHFGYQSAPDYSSVRGVSVSRVPRVASKGTKALSFVIDPEKMPTARPFTELDYRKMTEGVDDLSGSAPAQMNPLFEYENRTYDTAIPRNAIREMWLDKDAYLQHFLPGSDLESKLQTVRDLAGHYELPLREFESGREMHAGRATLSNMAKKKR